MFVPRLPPSSRCAGRLGKAVATWEDDGGAVTTLKGPLFATRNQVAGPERIGAVTDAV